MANPLHYVTPQFWEVAQDFDKLLSQMPVKLGPITPHLHQLLGLTPPGSGMLPASGETIEATLTIPH